jgi:hypothetical protein
MEIDNYEELPSQVLFNLKTIDELGIAKIATMKKIISNQGISIVKIGNKIHIRRSELIRYINANTIPRVRN